MLVVKGTGNSFCWGEDGFASLTINFTMNISLVPDIQQLLINIRRRKEGRKEGREGGREEVELNGRLIEEKYHFAYTSSEPL